MTTQAIAAASTDWKPLFPKYPFSGDAKQITLFLDGVTRGDAGVQALAKSWQHST